MKTITTAVLFLVAVFARAESESSRETERVRLVFSIDQGFGNGVAANGDVEALRRMIAALEPLRAKYQVCVLLNPMLKNKQRLHAVLNELVVQKMPFVLDVYSSDTFTLGANGPANAPFDASHGLAISPDELAAFKQRYAQWFAGLRFMEIFGQDFGVRAMKTTNAELKRPGDKLPDDNFFRPDLAERYICFAKEHGMFVQWADFGWAPFSPWDKAMPGYEAQVKELLKKYPGVVTVTYNNNEPNSASIPRLKTWRADMQPLIRESGAALGLSNQSWLHNSAHMDTKPAEIVEWTRSALDKKCRLIQFEPVWFFFHLPVGTFELGDSHAVPAGTQPGAAKESLMQLIGFLLAPDGSAARP